VVYLKDAVSITGDSSVVELDKDTDTSPVQKKKNETPPMQSSNKGRKKRLKV
jgi:hypothetical protein